MEINLDTFIDSIDNNKVHINKLYEISNIELDLFHQSQKLRHLYSLSINSKEIVNVGFDVGYEVLIFLISNPISKIHCLVNENNNHYTNNCFDYLSSMFPDRLIYYQEKSNYLLEHFKKVSIDLVNIHARNDLLASNILFFHFHGVSKNGTILIWNYSYMSNFRDFWLGYVKTNLIEEIPCIEMPEKYSHVIGRVCKQDHKIAVLSLAIGDEYKDITKYMRKSKLIYCQKHDYDFYEDEDVYDTAKPITWAKIKLILKYINKGYDYLVWLDADTFIMNNDISMDHIINTYIDKKDLLLVEDNQLANTGVMFIKCSDWSKIFFEAVYNEKFMNDQAYINSMYKANEMNSQEHINLLNVNLQSIFNSYWYNYKWSDFILHLVQTDIKDSSKKYCPIKMDDENFISYFNRLKWLTYECYNEAQKIYNL